MQATASGSGDEEAPIDIVEEIVPEDIRRLCTSSTVAATIWGHQRKDELGACICCLGRP